MSSNGAETEVLIIGGGIIGAAVAYRLTRAGAKVTLVDAAEPGHGTSASSFAWINSSHKRPQAYHDLNVAGIAEHHALAREFAAAPWLNPVGGLSWSTLPAGHERLRQDAARQSEWGYRNQAITLQEAQQLEPGLVLDADKVPEVWYAPNEGWVDAPLLIRTLLAEASAAGATIQPQSKVVAIARSSDRVTGVQLASGATIAVDTVVNCAGPQADAVAALLDWALPLDRLPGLLAVTGPLPQPGHCVCHTDQISYRPDPSGGLVIAHADDLDATIDATTPLTPLPPACAEALNRAARSFPSARAAGIVSARIGVRPLPRDGVTIAGQVPGFRNAYIAVTHSGITLGPLLGRLIAEEITAGTAPAQLAPFHPNRFPPTA